jgi:hypothetical protein
MLPEFLMTHLFKYQAKLGEMGGGGGGGMGGTVNSGILHTNVNKPPPLPHPQWFLYQYPFSSLPSYVTTNYRYTSKLCVVERG